MFPNNKNVEYLELFLDSFQIWFNVILVTETRILKNKFAVTNINLTNFSYEYLPTESSSECPLES